MRTKAASRSRQSWMRTKTITENNELIRLSAAALAEKLAAREITAVVSLVMLGVGVATGAIGIG